LGFAGPDADVELILMARQLWSRLGVSDLVTLEINCLGQIEERARHRVDLIRYLERHIDQLDDDARRRLHTNPLRVLDTKNPQMQELVAAAPRLIDYLGEDSLAHFDGVQSLLRAAGQPFTINPRLVRGLDYYNLTVFEWVTDRLGAQATVCAGGRYDGLIAQIGGRPAPACGWALGVERVLELLVEAGQTLPVTAPHAYAVLTSQALMPQAMPVCEALRAAGVRVQLHLGGGSMKSQMKKADASGARWALVFGEQELQQGQVGVKDLRTLQDASQQQQLLPLQPLEALVSALLRPGT
ncbi:MAG: histidine--tRNA ligase, partial [Thiomonas sp.]